jgi:hypothetical protein
MRSYSERHDDDINEDAFDDDADVQLNSSSSDIKLRRTSKIKIRRKKNYDLISFGIF